MKEGLPLEHESIHPGLDADRLDEGPRPEDSRHAEALVAEALQHPDLSPALRSLLAPVHWYLQRWHRELAAIRAPFHWIGQLRETVVAQDQQAQAWQHTVQDSGLRPFGEGAAGPVWVTHAAWPPDKTWVVLESEGHEVHHWANPTLRAVATAHPDGTIFVEQCRTQSAFLQQLDQWQPLSREEER